ncbi:MAG: XdhC family protein [Anaerolineales bacterium]|nr:XdhC family protein [Anaerolineales bacterium]
MNEIFDDIERWIAAGEKVALATVIETWGSSPRQVGAKMALTSSGKITGSVSGGCVEGAVYQAGVETLKTGQSQLLHFGVADETAWEVGLACGGTIQVFVQALKEQLFRTISACIQRDKPLVYASVVKGREDLCGKSLLLCNTDTVFSELDKSLEGQIMPAAVKHLSGQKSQRMDFEAEVEGSVEVFFDVMLPPPTLVIVGGVHIAIALARIAKVLDYQTIIVDPRASFSSKDRFPHVDRLIQAWPEEAFTQINFSPRTAVVVLTHDPKIDDAALKIVVNKPVFYIGVLGSRGTQDKRRARLLNAGVSETQIGLFHAPIGIDIGAKTPEEIGLAIMAEIVAVQRQAALV